MLKILMSSNGFVIKWASASNNSLKQENNAGWQGVIHLATVAYEKGRGTYSRGSQRKIGPPEHAFKIVRGACRMAQSKDTGMEKLLLHELQSKEVSQTGLVYFAAVNTMVREEETKQKMDGLTI